MSTVGVYIHSHTTNRDPPLVHIYHHSYICYSCSCMHIWSHLPVCSRTCIICALQCLILYLSLSLSLSLSLYSSSLFIVRIYLPLFVFVSTVRVISSVVEYVLSPVHLFIFYFPTCNIFLFLLLSYHLFMLLYYFSCLLLSVHLLLLLLLNL